MLFGLIGTKNNNSIRPSLYSEDEVKELNAKLLTLDLVKTACFNKELGVIIYIGFAVITENNKQTTYLYFKRACNANTEKSSTYNVEEFGKDAHDFIERAKQERFAFIELKNQLQVFGFDIIIKGNDNKQ